MGSSGVGRARSKLRHIDCRQAWVEALRDERIVKLIIADISESSGICEALVHVHAPRAHVRTGEGYAFTAYFIACTGGLGGTAQPNGFADTPVASKHTAQSCYKPGEITHPDLSLMAPISLSQNYFHS